VSIETPKKTRKRNGPKSNDAPKPKRGRKTQNISNEFADTSTLEANTPILQMTSPLLTNITKRGKNGRQRKLPNESPKLQVINDPVSPTPTKSKARPLKNRLETEVILYEQTRPVTRAVSKRNAK
jgi:hypothetical protein